MFTLGSIQSVPKGIGAPPIGICPYSSKSVFEVHPILGIVIPEKSIMRTVGHSKSASFHALSYMFGHVGQCMIMIPAPHPKGRQQRSHRRVDLGAKKYRP